MGFLCCRTDDRDHSASHRTATLIGTTSTAKTTTTTTATVGKSYAASNNNEGPAAATSSSSLPLSGVVARADEDDNDDDQGSMELFYDAAESFSDMVGRLSYPPTAVMRRSVFVLDDTHNDHDNKQRKHKATTPTTVRRLSIEQPDTMLLSSFETAPSLSIKEQEIEQSEAERGDKLGQVATVVLRESIVQVTNELQKHHIFTSQQQQDGQQRMQGGYPGELSLSELEACLKFRQKLKEGDVALNEMVHVFAPMEDEAFALCRILRGESFRVDNVFAKFQEKNVIEMWERARKDNFWTDLEAHFHCPLPVLLQLFPIVSAGLATNGCTIWYIKTSQIDIDGIECIVDLPNMMPYMWHVLHHQGKAAMKREMEHVNDNIDTTILAEKIIVIDMQGIPWALFGSDGMEFIKEAAKAASCFPEVLNRMYLVNVPVAFSVVWAALKLYAEPRTIQKIGFFSYASKAKRDLQLYIPNEQLLSNFGGQGPSFQTIMEERQQEYSNYCYSRYVVQVMVVKFKESKFSFALDNNERVGNFTIYSQNDNGAIFTVKSTTTTSGMMDTIVDSMMVSRQASGDTRKHYSVEIPCHTNHHPIITGPNTFTVYAKLIGDTTTTAATVGNFLVAISISNNEQR